MQKPHRNDRNPPASRFPCQHLSKSAGRRSSPRDMFEHRESCWFRIPAQQLMRKAASLTPCRTCKTPPYRCGNARAWRRSLPAPRPTKSANIGHLNRIPRMGGHLILGSKSDHFQSSTVRGQNSGGIRLAVASHVTALALSQNSNDEVCLGRARRSANRTSGRFMLRDRAPLYDIHLTGPA